MDKLPDRWAFTCGSATPDDQMGPPPRCGSERCRSDHAVVLPLKPLENDHNQQVDITEGQPQRKSEMLDHLDVPDVWVPQTSAVVPDTGSDTSP